MKNENKKTKNNKDVESAQIKELELKIEELENNWKRALADYTNLQRRVAQDAQNTFDSAYMDVFRMIIPIFDNLRMVARYSEDEGLKLTIKEFEKTLESLNVTEINPEKEEFDSLTMEAIEAVEGKKNIVIEVSSVGYMYKNKVLRPALVKVGKGHEEDE
jgi:molecular chaperone GrpE